jgi:hypothetical protein
MADICIPLPFVMLLGAVTLGLFIGIGILGFRFQRLQHRVERVLGPLDIHE